MMHWYIHRISIALNSEPLKAHHIQVKPPETSPVRQFIAHVVR
jgi:hypothetical protein